MRYIKKIILSIREEEQKSDLSPQYVIASSRQIASVLLDKLELKKEYILENGFAKPEEEIEFFKKIKPEVQGKLIFYNKVFKIESSCPPGMWEVHKKYFSDELQKIENIYRENTCNCPFYRYYRSGRIDRDEELFIRGQINIDNGLNSHIFESDHRFSAYFDYKVARIIGDELFYDYLIFRINSGLFDMTKAENLQQLVWTDSKNSLIELIYALHVNGAILNGNINVRKIASAVQSVFNIELGDTHHAFHRMKMRAGSKTAYLDQLKKSLEKYMDKDF
mgnify:CR=1 FL=1